MNVFAAVITSSPGPTPNARSASSMAARPVPHRNGVPRADERGVLGFEPFDRRAHDEVAPLEDRVDRRLDLRGERAMLRFQVDERHVHGRNHFLNPRPRYTTGRRMLHQSTNGRIFV